MNNTKPLRVVTIPPENPDEVASRDLRGPRNTYVGSRRLASREQIEMANEFRGVAPPYKSRRRTAHVEQVAAPEVG